MTESSIKELLDGGAITKNFADMLVEQLHRGDSASYVLMPNTERDGFNVFRVTTRCAEGVLSTSAADND